MPCNCRVPGSYPQIAGQLLEFGNVEGELMASQNIVLPGELPSAEANPSKVCCLCPKLDYSKQSWIGVNLEIEERSLAEFYLAEGQRLAHMGSWAWNAADRSAVYLSEEWYRSYGFDPALGAPVWEKRLERVHPEDRFKWKSTIELAILEKADFDVDFRIVLPD